MASDRENKTTSMDSSFPVFLPEEPLVHTPRDKFYDAIFKEFDNAVLKKLDYSNVSSYPPLSQNVDLAIRDGPPKPATDAAERLAESASYADMLRHAAQKAPDQTLVQDKDVTSPSTSGNAFADALSRAAQVPTNRTLTDNSGVAFASTESPLVELFRHLEGDWTERLAATLTPLLEEAWAHDPLSTLKIIWNTRSIHLGKSEKDMFYVALGWLSKKHPRTLLINLQWLFRPVIQKDNKERADDDKIIIEKVGDEVDDYDVPDGVSHGYWKDLLNILVLASNNKLDMSNTKSVLAKRNVQVDHELPFPQDSKKQKLYRNMDYKERREFRKTRSLEDRVADGELYNSLQKSAAKDRKHREEADRHSEILKLLAEDEFYRALHYTVARLFAEQLSKDMLVLKTTEPKQMLKGLTLCGKWAPSLEGFHDKHTMIATTIAEILFPPSRIGQDGDTRELYLKRARHHYRKYTLSPLRKALQVVERDITAETFSKINYSRVPSLAMDRYKGLFERKDTDRFTKYALDVAMGKRSISGAVLTPGLLVSQLQKTGHSVVEQTIVNSQWNTLVQRIKDSGSLSDSIAVCDVSGSMFSPIDRQGVSPLHTAVGLSLIIAAVTKAPFGGKVITFSESPRVVEVGGENDKRTLNEQVEFLERADWGMNTNFVKIFTNLILPIAVENKVSKEDMVKRIFVFSDMHFDSAQYSTKNPWATHHQIIEKKFAAAGYDVPELVYWNLCDNSRSRPAPVTAEMPGTALVGGRSQALIKVFLENGGFEEEEEEEGEGEEEFQVVEAKTGETAPAKKKKKPMTALSVVKKAISHKAYDMLKVVD